MALLSASLVRVLPTVESRLLPLPPMVTLHLLFAVTLPTIRVLAQVLVITPVFMVPPAMMVPVRLDRSVVKSLAVPLQGRAAVSGKPLRVQDLFAALDRMVTMMFVRPRVLVQALVAMLVPLPTVMMVRLLTQHGLEKLIRLLCLGLTATLETFRLIRLLVVMVGMTVLNRRPPSLSLRLSPLVSVPVRLTLRFMHLLPLRPLNGGKLGEAFMASPLVASSRTLLEVVVESVVAAAEVAPLFAEL